jgi:hypothetical protein
MGMYHKRIPDRFMHGGFNRSLPGWLLSIAATDRLYWPLSMGLLLYAWSNALEFFTVSLTAFSSTDARLTPLLLSI